MNYGLSILIPTYNNICVNLVKVLYQQAYAIKNLDFEIIVADDGSKDTECINANKLINDIPNCQYIINEENKGRSSIRNFLDRRASFPWLLFLDSDVNIDNKDFISRYTSFLDVNGDVIYGGVTTSTKSYSGNLRWKYEQAEEPSHCVTKRMEKPYNSFRTTNFVVRKSTMISLPFDETITTYGYEDVIFGISLEKQHKKIVHIDNPCTLGTPENNERYLSKLNEALYTLSTLEGKLSNHSPILSTTKKLKKIGMMPLVILWHKIFNKAEYRNLTSKNPSLLILKLYKLGTFATIIQRQKK